MADYHKNTAAYEKNCVNKAKTKMQCKGKCQMIKKLQQEEKKEQENSDKKGENKFYPLSSKSFFTTFSLNVIHFSKKNYPTLKVSKEIKQSFEIFHPPSC